MAIGVRNLLCSGKYDDVFNRSNKYQLKRLHTELLHSFLFKQNARVKKYVFVNKNNRRKEKKTKKSYHVNQVTQNIIIFRTIT